MNLKACCLLVCLFFAAPAICQDFPFKLLTKDSVRAVAIDFQAAKKSNLIARTKNSVFRKLHESQKETTEKKLKSLENWIARGLEIGIQKMGLIASKPSTREEGLESILIVKPIHSKALQLKRIKEYLKSCPEFPILDNLVGRLLAAAEKMRDPVLVKSGEWIGWKNRDQELVPSEMRQKKFKKLVRLSHESPVSVISFPDAEIREALAKYLLQIHAGFSVANPFDPLWAQWELLLPETGGVYYLSSTMNSVQIIWQTGELIERDQGIIQKEMEWLVRQIGKKHPVVKNTFQDGVKFELREAHRLKIIFDTDAIANVLRRSAE